MKVFLSGEQDKDFIESTLEELKDNLGMTSICGVITSPCMQHVIPWAENNKFKLSLHFPASDSEEDKLISSISSISSDKPGMILLYDETEEFALHLESEAESSGSVQFFMRKSL